MSFPLCRVLPLWLVVFFLSAQGCIAESDTGIGCVTSMTIPRFKPGLMAFAPASGRIFVTIGDGGRALAERFDGSNWRVNDELQILFRDLAKYSPKCDGMTITFKVTWLLEGDVRVAEPSATVKYVSPDEFIVYFPPMEPRKLKRPSKR